MNDLNVKSVVIHTGAWSNDTCLCIASSRSALVIVIVFTLLYDEHYSTFLSYRNANSTKKLNMFHALRSALCPPYLTMFSSAHHPVHVLTLQTAPIPQYWMFPYGFLNGNIWCCSVGFVLSTLPLFVVLRVLHEDY